MPRPTFDPTAKEDHTRYIADQTFRVFYIRLRGDAERQYEGYSDVRAYSFQDAVSECIETTPGCEAMIDLKWDFLDGILKVEDLVGTSLEAWATEIADKKKAA